MVLNQRAAGGVQLGSPAWGMGRSMPAARRSAHTWSSASQSCGGSTPAAAKA